MPQASDIFDQDDYRDGVSARLAMLKKTNPKIYSAQKLAASARVHPPFLSAVLNKKLHFNSDQLFLTAKYLGLNRDEKEYLETLFEENRSSNRGRREALQSQLQSLRRKFLRTSGAVQSELPNVGLNAWQEYFLNPRHQMLHMAMTVERFRRSPATAADLLQVSSEEIDASLRLLLSLEILAISDGEYLVRKQMMHLPEESSMIESFQQSARLVALRKRRQHDDTRFSVFFTANQKTAALIRSEFNQFLKTIQPLVKDAPAEELFQLNFDFLEWK